ncbi:MAG: DUF2244 domain-containing protein, partial [Verrucomicrobia bacterium]|nr:DUF2244 domain-containing protein [Verrucomicrobiota bacterium]
ALVLIFPVVGTALFLIGLNQFVVRGRIRVTETDVSFDRKTLFGHTVWTEPLARYPGLRFRTEDHSGGKNKPAYTLHIVELHHPEKAKRVVVYQSKSPEGARGIWEDSCRALNLPALEAAGGTVARREVADLDKSVRDLVRERKLSVQFDPRQTPPEGIRMEVGKDQLHIEVVLPRLPLKVTVPWMVAALGIAGLPFLLPGAPMVLCVIGLVVLAIPMAWTALAGRIRQQLEVSRAGVRVVWRTPWGSGAETVFPAGEIEQVEILNRGGNQASALYIVTDKREMAIGPFLKPEAREWLRNCLLAVTSH